MTNIESLLKNAREAEKAGLHSAAYELFKKIHLLTPQRDDVCYRAARNLLDCGRVTEAEDWLESARNIPSNKLWLISLLFGELCLAQFKPAEAERHFRQAVSLNPESTSPAIFLADCLWKQEKNEEALRVLTQALRAKGDVDEVYLNLGLIKRTQGEYEAAREFLLSAIRANPDYPAARDALADVDRCLAIVSEQS